LADENIPLAVVGALRERGHDVLWVREDSPGPRIGPFSKPPGYRGASF
jgi:hypothetical protein